jgi:hypothetical protein
MKLHLHETDCSLQKKRTTTQTHQTRAPHPKPKTTTTTPTIYQSLLLTAGRPITQKEKEPKKGIDHISVVLLHKCTTTATKCKCKSSMAL